ncbi:MAG: hypothetical protein CMJ83_09845 [Planctomycetes bacterium]|nr:hypothetical protein [Planctomycetota bacterium]
MEDSAFDRLYDRYLNAALRGEVEDPSAFCARHGVDDPELRASLEAVRLASSGSAAAGGATPPAERLGPYRLIRPLGEGGMGVVWLAEQEDLGRRAAVKVIRPELAASPSVSARFQREAEAIARLTHPHVVTVFDAGVQDGIQWLAMELVPGRSLADVLAAMVDRSEDVPPARVIRWFSQIAEALHAAHEAGIVHRDVKPSNIRISQKDDALLLDFGLARDVGATRETMTGGFTGSPTYASPEQWSSDRGPLDHRTDIWSLGVALYEALCGTPPFAADTVEQLMHATLTEEPTPPRHHDRSISRDLDVVVTKCLEKDPARRYASAGVLANDLRAVMELRTISARPAGPLVRATKWTRRHRRIAATLLGLVLLSGSVLGYHLWSTITAATDQEEEAKALVVEAHRTLAEAYATYAHYSKLRNSTAILEQLSSQRYLTVQEQERLKRERRERKSAVVDMELASDEAHALLSKAAQLDPTVESLDDGWREYWFRRWTIGSIREDWESTAHYGDLVLKRGWDDPLSKKVLGRVSFSLDSEPSGARIYLHRLSRTTRSNSKSEPRWIPASSSHAIDSRIKPGTMLLRIVVPRGEKIYQSDLITTVATHAIEGVILSDTSKGDVRRGDRLLSIDDDPVHALADVEDSERPNDGSILRYVFVRGDEKIEVSGPSLSELGIEVVTPAELVRRGSVKATVWHKNRIREHVLQAGMDVQPTAAPIIIGHQDVIGRTPTSKPLLPSPYVAVIRKIGFQDRRILFQVPHSGLDPKAKPIVRFAELIPLDAVHDGFVYVSCDDPICSERPFWMMAREVTAAEYLAFLNDPETDRSIRESGNTRHLPGRSVEAQDGLGQWRRGQDGRWRLPPEESHDFPALGISGADAAAYARWMNRTRPLPDGARYGLPKLQDYHRASLTGGIRDFVFGSVFVPGWVKSRFSRPRPRPEPVLRYPFDESVWGIYDLAGSASEWLANTRRRDGTTQRRMAGGSWRDADPKRFKIQSGRWLNQDETQAGFGFRLVIRERPR